MRGKKGEKEALKEGVLKLAWTMGREAGTSLLQREQNLQEDPGPGKQASLGEKKSDEQSLETRISCLLEASPHPTPLHPAVSAALCSHGGLVHSGGSVASRHRH